MTQEFEKWCCFENLGVSPDLNASHVRAAKAAWQASIEQLKAKMLSDEMFNLVSEIIWETGDEIKPSDADTKVKAALETIVREL